MKKILFGLFILPFFAFSQVKTPAPRDKSNIEDFSERSGSFTQKVITDVSKVDGVKIQFLKITDLVTNKTVVGLRLEAAGSNTYSSSHVAFLDADEIDGLIKTIDYVAEKVFSTDPLTDYTEYNYLSRSGFTAGAFNYNKRWLFYMKLEKYSGDSQFSFGKDDLDKIKTAIIAVKAKI